MNRASTASQYPVSTILENLTAFHKVRPYGAWKEVGKTAFRCPDKLQSPESSQMSPLHYYIVAHLHLLPSLYRALSGGAHIITVIDSCCVHPSMQKFNTKRTDREARLYCSARHRMARLPIVDAGVSLLHRLQLKKKPLARKLKKKQCSVD